MAPGRNRGRSKPQTTDVPVTEYEKERSQRMMRNNQVLQNLGVTQLASIINSSSDGKSNRVERVAREVSGSLYEPADDAEDNEHCVVDKNLDTSRIMGPSGGTRGSKRALAGPAQQDTPARVTRQRTREQSYINDPSSNAEDVADAAQAAPAPAQVEGMEDMDNGGEPNDMPNQRTRGRSMGKDLEKMCRGLNSKLPVVIVEGKRRPEAPMQAAKLASEGGIVLRQHMPIHTHWKVYKNDNSILADYMGKVSGKFFMDTKDKAVQRVCSDLLKGGQRQMRHTLKKKWFDDVPANKVRTTSPLNGMTDNQWKALVQMWSSPKHMKRCLKAKLSREKVKFHHKTGSRCYIAQTHVVALGGGRPTNHPYLCVVAVTKRKRQDGSKMEAQIKVESRHKSKKNQSKNRNKKSRGSLFGQHQIPHAIRRRRAARPARFTSARLLLLLHREREREEAASWLSGSRRPVAAPLPRRARTTPVSVSRSRSSIPPARGSSTPLAATQQGRADRRSSSPPCALLAPALSLRSPLLGRCGARN